MTFQWLLKYVVNVATLLAILVPTTLRLAADEPKPNSDPLEGAFFPPELVMLARDRIGLTPEQYTAFRERVEKSHRQSEELRTKLEREMAALATIAKQARPDEAALIVQLDKVLDAERDAKRLHLGLMVAIKNLLTDQQQTQLREIAKSGHAQLAEEMRKRLTAKVERVQSGIEGLAQAGRDPAPYLKMMEENVKPLLDGGKPMEAETELDRVLERIKQDSK